MKIQKIEIKGLFGKKDIAWELNPQVNVLVGVNGSGKSTILIILYELLRQKSPANQKFKLLNDFSVTATNNSVIKAKSVSAPDFSSTFQQVVSDIKLHYPNINVLEVFDYITEMSENIHDFLDILYIDLIEANLTNSNANHIIQKSNRGKTNALDMEIRETIYELNKIANPELLERLAGCLNVFFNQIGKHAHFNENNELEYTDTQLQKKLNYSDLSSGERQLIYILLRVALSNGDKSKTAIILMDEPEISLHLDWQEHFIKQITILNPDAQFIIVTHSPALIMNGWNDKYVDMEEITTWQ